MRRSQARFLYIFFLFSILPPPGLLPVLGQLTRDMTPTLDAALLYVVHRDGVTTNSSRAGAGSVIGESSLVDSVHRASPLYL